MMPDIRHRHGNEFRKSARTIHADSLRVLAQMPAPSQTIPASPAYHVPLRAHHVAGMKIHHVRSNPDDFAHKLMAHNHWNRDRFLRPSVPFIDMQVRPANSRPIHSNQDIIDSNLRNCNFLQRQPCFRLTLHQRFHLRFAHCVSFHHNPLYRTDVRYTRYGTIRYARRFSTISNVKKNSTKATEPESINRHLGDRVKRLRSERGWSLEALANSSGVSRSMLS